MDSSHVETRWEEEGVVYIWPLILLLVQNLHLNRIVSAWSYAPVIDAQLSFFLLYTALGFSRYDSFQ